MAGTDALHSPNGEAKLAVLVEQVQSLRADVSGLMTQLSEVAAALNGFQLNFTRELLATAAQSTANKTAIEALDRKVDHKDQSAIARDQQQVTMLRDEAAARDKALAEIKADLAAIKKDQEDSRFWSRILTGAVGLGASVLGGVIVSLVARGLP